MTPRLYHKVRRFLKQRSRKVHLDENNFLEIKRANIVAPREKSEAVLATPGFLINMGFGTFVEAAYPFMFSNKIFFAGAIISSGVAGMLVGFFDVRGTAYVPSIMALLLSNNMRVYSGDG